MCKETISLRERAIIFYKNSIKEKEQQRREYLDLVIKEQISPALYHLLNLDQSNLLQFSCDIEENRLKIKVEDLILYATEDKEYKLHFYLKIKCPVCAFSNFFEINSIVDIGAYYSGNINYFTKEICLNKKCGL